MEEVQTMNNESKPCKKLVVEFIPPDVQVDIKNPDSQSSLVQLMLQVAKIGLRVDKEVNNNGIINKEYEHGK